MRVKSSIGKWVQQWLRSLAWRVLYVGTCLVPRTPRVTVLLYHSISTSSDFFAVSPAVFERHMRELSRQVDLVPLSRAFRHAAGESVKRDSVAITFDDGYLDFAMAALPILKQHNIPATVFVLGGVPDQKDLGNDFARLGTAERELLTHPLVSVGSHSHTHRKLTKLSVEEVQQELEDSKKAIKNQFGVDPHYLAYPKGSYNQSVMQRAQTAGYSGAVSVVERGVRVGDNTYALPRIQVDSSTTNFEFRAKRSLAADWYYRVWLLLSQRNRK